MCKIFLIFAAGLAFEAAAAPPVPTQAATPAAPATVTNQSPVQAQTAPLLPAPPPATPSARTVTPKKDLYWFTPAPSENQNRIQWYGNISSRPWTTVVGWHPGQSQFPTGETAEPQLVLLQEPF